MVYYGKRLTIMRKQYKEHRRLTLYIAIMQKLSMISLGSPATCVMYKKSSTHFKIAANLNPNYYSVFLELEARTFGLRPENGSI